MTILDEAWTGMISEQTIFQRPRSTDLPFPVILSLTGAGQDGRRRATEPRRPADGAKENRGAIKKKVEQLLDIVLHDFHDVGYIFRHFFFNADFSEATVDVVVGM